jgi:hypothetical protein
MLLPSCIAGHFRFVISKVSKYPRNARLQKHLENKYLSPLVPVPVGVNLAQSFAIVNPA